MSDKSEVRYEVSTLIFGYAEALMDCRTEVALAG